MKKFIKKIKKIDNSLLVTDYLKDFVTPEIFFEGCESGCLNYGKLWCCPPYDFNVLDYWHQYDIIELSASVIYLTDEALSRTYSEGEISSILDNIGKSEISKLTEEMYSKEDKNSIALSAGCCNLCESCTRPDGLPCRYPDKMRYSIESLGGNVGMTCSRLLNVSPVWIEEGKLPSHIILVCGLLKKAR